jgi:aryl-alcohol dehydrogenase-like predicted oxidoreductase
MSEFYGDIDEQESIRTLERSLELGVGFFDTADFYALGKNEELISKVLRTNRDKMFISDKFGALRGPNGEFLGYSGKRDFVKSSCEASLKRLNTDYIDLYTLARVDPNT